MRQSVLLWVANLFTDKLLENLSPSRLWKSQQAAGQSATDLLGPQLQVDNAHGHIVGGCSFLASSSKTSLASGKKAGKKIRGHREHHQNGLIGKCLLQDITTESQELQKHLGSPAVFPIIINCPFPCIQFCNRTCKAYF